MLKEIVEHINTKIAALQLFEKTYGLCEAITKDGKSFPAEYCKNEYKQVGDFDKYKGVVYHRLTGSIETEELDEEQTVSCDPFYQRTFPFRTVALIKKSELGIDNDAYLGQRVAQDLLITIGGANNKTLRQDLRVDSISFEVTNLITDRDTIFQEEYKGMDNFFRYEYMYIAIDYEVIVSGSFSCSDLICQ
jgi:hypothetical protein